MVQKFRKAGKFRGVACRKRGHGGEFFGTAFRDFRCRYVTRRQCAEGERFREGGSRQIFPFAAFTQVAHLHETDLHRINRHVAPEFRAQGNLPGFVGSE